jgi:hypothetical protein
MFHPVALALKEHNMPMVSKPIDHRGCHLIVSEDCSPLRKLKVRGEHNTPPLIGVSDNPKKELSSLAINRHIAQFINNE